MSTETNKPEAAKPERASNWVLANPGKQGVNYIKGPTGQMMEVTNASLKNPNMLKTIEHIEATSGKRLFGVDPPYT